MAYRLYPNADRALHNLRRQMGETGDAFAPYPASWNGRRLSMQMMPHRAPRDLHVGMPADIGQWASGYALRRYGIPKRT